MCVCVCVCVYVYVCVYMSHRVGVWKSRENDRHDISGHARMGR
jgi:hypothetical protein